MPDRPVDVGQGHLMPSIVQVNAIRAWLDGEAHPEHDTFSMGREFAKALVHEFDRLTLAAGARATEVEAVWIEEAERVRAVIAKHRERIMSLGLGRDGHGTEWDRELWQVLDGD